MTALATTDTATLQAMLVDLRARCSRQFADGMDDFAWQTKEQIQQIDEELKKREQS
jgi:hypothetical protein